MAPHSSILAWKIPWAEEPGRLQSMGSLGVRHDWVTSLSLFLSCIGEGSGNPLQCSSLESPRDGGAWWAAVYGVAQSRTLLKWLSSSSSNSGNPTDGDTWNAAVHGVTNSWTRLSDFTFTFPFKHWRRKWQPAPVFLPGESQGQWSLMGSRLWGCTESDTTEVTYQQQQQTQPWRSDDSWDIDKSQTCYVD